MINKWNYFMVGCLSVSVVALCSTGSYAQYYDNPIRRGLEHRVDRLERSAQSMQAQINRLEEQIRHLQRGPSLPLPPVPPYSTQWTCSIEAGGYSYSSTRPTRVEATNRALEKCRAGSGHECSVNNVVCNRQ